jgi:hypothetical protein
MDKVTEAVLAALKQALTETGEQRLFKSGKLAGLFPARTGVNAAAAAKALQDGLLEIVRTETKGKTAIEWARLTPRGIDFLHDTEAPVVVLRELRSALQTARDGVPAWLGQLHEELLAFESRMTEDVRKYLAKLDALAGRVDQALRRLGAGPGISDSLAAVVPWAAEALAYLDRRKNSGAGGDCPLPELFAAVRERCADLTLTAFHDGLRRLTDGKAVRLLPFVAPPEQLPEPEYALLDGGAVVYYAAPCD